MRTRIARNEIGQEITLYWCERCTGWHDLNEDPEPVKDGLDGWRALYRHYYGDEGTLATDA